MKGMQKWNDIAFQNMVVRLKTNPYPGRGIVVGMSDDGRYVVQISWTMGRGKDSRNRVYERDGTRVFTEAADPSLMTPKKARNIIYTAMREDRQRGLYLVSNGNQTDSVIEKTQLVSLNDGIHDRTYEDDPPNFTPRITGLCNVGNGFSYAELAIIRKSELTTELITHGDCQRFCFGYGHIVPGFGFCITTYLDDGDPLPAFEGEPYPISIVGDLDDVAANYWHLLNPDNRVSIAVKFIELATGQSQIKIINKYKKVVSPPAA